MNQLKIKKLHSDAILPFRAYPGDAGADLYSIESKTVEPGEGYKFSTGIAADLPDGCYAHVHTRSSMAKLGWTVIGGVIDKSYKGELFVVLRNISKQPMTVETHQRIAQLVIYPIYTPEIIEVRDVGYSDRADSGFGSSGR